MNICPHPIIEFATALSPPIFSPHWIRPCVMSYCPLVFCSTFSSLITIDNEASSQNSSTGSKDKDSEAAGKKIENESKPLLTKKIVLGILSELVKSYSSVAQLVAEYEIQTPGKQSSPQVGKK